METDLTANPGTAEMAPKRPQVEQFAFDLDTARLIDVASEGHHKPEDHQYTVFIDVVTGDAMALPARITSTAMPSASTWPPLKPRPTTERSRCSRLRSKTRPNPKTATVTASTASRAGRA